MNEITLYRATAACWSRRDQTEYDFEAVDEQRHLAEERALHRAHKSRNCVTDHEHLRRVERFVIETVIDPGDRDPVLLLAAAQSNGDVVEREVIDDG